ncbi:zinc finger, CCHC-type containing protein [Tanacetum coccineum]
MVGRSIPGFDSLHWDIFATVQRCCADSLLLMLRNAILDISVEDFIVWNPSPDDSNLSLVGNSRMYSVKFVLGQRGVIPFGQEINCVWCLDEVESVDHLLLHYPRSFDIWTSLFKWWSILWILPSSLANYTSDWNIGMGINEDSIDLNGATRNTTRLRLFCFSFRDQAINWLERLPAGPISTWDDLTTRFLAQFFPPGRTTKLQKDILMFQQRQDESLYDTWTRFKDLLQKVPHHGLDLWL